jgi:hypothetical protein
MWRRGTPRIVIALALAAALLATSAPLAAQPYGPAPAASWRQGWDVLWTWARLALRFPSRTPHLKCDGGSSIDPNGRCKAASATRDGGLSIDPNGLRSSENDGGLQIDPNG